MSIKDEVLRIFEENGVDVAEELLLIDIDSLQFIAVIVEIEQLLGIALPDYLLLRDENADVKSFMNVVIDIYNSKTNG